MTLPSLELQIGRARNEKGEKLFYSCKEEILVAHNGSGCGIHDIASLVHAFPISPRVFDIVELFCFWRKLRMIIYEDIYLHQQPSM